MEYLTLNTGDQVPVLGFGTYLINPEDAQAAVYEAIKAGYRSIDTSQDYYNEREVGQGIAQAINEGLVKREDLFVTTKVDTDGYEAGKRGIDESLRKLGLDYLDMMILHWPRRDDLGSYRVLEEYHQAGKIRNIGLSNFNIAQTKAMIAQTKIRPAVDQIETNLYLQQGKLHDFLQKEQMVHESWSPLAQGAKNLNTNPVLAKIGQKYGKTGVQVLLRFLTQWHVMTIPRSINPQHIKSNFDIFDFKLTAEEMKAIRALDQHRSATGWPSSMRVDA